MWTGPLRRELRDLSHVPRWGIARTIKTQSVAEHSYYVVAYSLFLAEEVLGIKDEIFLLSLAKAALYHDVEECFMSDIPGPSKRNVIDKDKADKYVRGQITMRFGPSMLDARLPLSDPRVRAIVKTADLIDEVAYLSGEVQMGNGSLSSFLKSAVRRLRSSFSSIEAMGVTVTRESAIDKIMVMLEGCMYGQSLPPMNDEDVAT